MSRAVLLDADSCCISRQSHPQLVTALLCHARQDEDIVQLFTDASLDPELANSVTAVRVVSS